MRSALLILCLMLAACAGVLGIKPKSDQRPFEHRAHSLKGVDCETCHTGIAKAGPSEPLHLPSTAQCVSCHKKPHDARTCSACHGVEATRQGAALAAEHLRFDHKAHLGTVRGQCVPCHVSAGAKEQPSMRPTMATCFGCHEHRDQWRVRDCDGCHRDLAVENGTPKTHVVHDGDFVREHGVRAASMRDLCATCHSENSCAACHGVSTAALPVKLAFDSPRLSGLHRAGFKARHSEEARSSPGLCTSCHDADNFCRNCHEEKRVAATGTPGSSPHPPDWVRSNGGEHGREARVDPMSCASCHGGAGESLCAGCHRVGGPGGNPHGRGFASTLDKTRDQPCRMCHAS